MVTHENLVRDAARLIVWYPMRWFVACLPLRSAVAFLRLVGRCHYRCSRSKRLRGVEF